MGYDYSYIDTLDAFAGYYIVASIFSILSTIAAIIVATIIAKKKGRSGGWGWLALLIGWIAVIIVACLPSENKANTYNTNSYTNSYSNTPYGNTNYGASWTCSNCNSVNDSTSLFCSNCGNAKQNKWKCKECNILNDPNNNYCSNCGSKKPE